MRGLRILRESFKILLHMNSFKVVLLTLLLFFAIRVDSQNKNDKSKMTDKAAEKIASLPEIIKADNYCKKLSHGKRHLVTYVAADPNGDENYYLIRVAEDNGSAFHAWFLFAFYPDSYKIEYIDRVSGNFIPLKRWQKNFKLSDL